MSRGKKRNVRNAKSVQNVKNLELGGSFIRAMNEGNLVNVQNLVHSHGISSCEGWYGSYALLRDAIESRHFEIAKFLLQSGAKTDCETDFVSVPLHFATEQRNLELVQLLLDQNVRIDAQNGKKETALHMAAKEGYTEIVEVLLNYSANVTLQTNTGCTPFLLAAEGLHEGILQMLLAHTCASFNSENDPLQSKSEAEKRYSTPLDRILLRDPLIHERNIKLVERILKLCNKSQLIDDLMDHSFTMRREYVDEYFLHCAISTNRTKLIKNVLTVASAEDAKHNFLPLYSAVKSKNEKVVDIFANLGFEVNCESEDEGGNAHSDEEKLAKVVEFFLTSGANVKQAPDFLCVVFEQNLIEVCKVLIKNGADVSTPNTDGRTPLHLCCNETQDKGTKQKKDDMLKLLLNSTVNVNIEDRSGFTAFHRAVWNGREGAVCIFLDFGVNVDLRTKTGSTPLYLASEMGHTEIIEILVKNKANLEARSDDGRTPLHCAASQVKAKAVEMLLQFGADVEALGCDNQTALHFTFDARGFDESIVKMLLYHGCDANARTHGGKTVLDFAREKGYQGPLYCIFFNSKGIPGGRESRGSIEYRKGVELVEEHLLKLETAGLCKENSDQFIEINDTLSEFREKCKEEINRMKSEKIEPQLSLYEILLRSKSPLFARNKSLMQTLESFNLDSFPIYSSLIGSFLERSKSRIDLTDAGLKSLAMLVKTSCKSNGKVFSVLPVELLEQIVGYLSNKDLRSLILCRKFFNDNTDS